MPHTGKGSIEMNVKEWAENKGLDGESYWEENKAKILKTANKYGALDVAGARGPLNSRQRRRIRRAEERSEDQEQHKQDFEEPEEPEEERSLTDILLGWLLGRLTPR